MKIRLYISHHINPSQDLVLHGNQAHYLCNVMRCKVGDKIRVFNHLEWLAVIKSINNKEIILSIEERFLGSVSLPSSPLLTIKQNLKLTFAPIKVVTPSFIAQKATELGVDYLQPIIMERSVVKSVRDDKVLSTIIEAAEQCGRVTIPKLLPIFTVEALIKQYNSTNEANKEIILLFDVGNALCKYPNQLPEIIKERVPAHVPEVIYNIIIGPEGGISPQEKEALVSLCNSIPVTLGKNTLRAETAIIAAISSIKTVLGIE